MNKELALKIVSCFLIIVLVIPYACGCSKKTSNDPSRIIQENTPWFQCENHVCSLSYKDSSVEYVDPECIVFRKYSENIASNKLVYSDNDNDETIIDFSQWSEGNEQFNINCYFRAGDDVYVTVSSTKKGVNSNSAYRIDHKNAVLEYISDFMNYEEESYYIDKVIFLNDHYYSHINYLDNYNYKEAFCIFDSDFNLIHEMRINNHIMTWSLNANSQIIAVEKDLSNPAESFYYSAVLNLETGTETRTAAESEKFEMNHLGYTSTDGFCYKMNKDMTITKLNLETGEESLVLDFNNSSINLFEMQCSTLRFCSDVKCILLKDTVYPSESPNYKINTLSRAEKNPHVGKQILYVAPRRQVGSMVASAIEQINTTSQDIYVNVTMEYSTLTFDEYEKTDDETVRKYNRDIALINKLKQDIRNGSGPDIVLDFAQYSALNNEDYLCDLSGIINDKDKFDRTEYFDNIFDAYVKDNKLFQMPVSACVGGIYANDDAVADSRQGFTYSEYESAVSTLSDGMDPFEFDYGRDSCFSMMISCNYDELYDGEHRLNVDNSSFRNICEYVRDMREEPKTDNARGSMQFVEFYRIHFDLSRMMINENKQLFGMPSTDGTKGPIVFAMESIGICSCTNQFDSAFDFVKCLLSYDVQIQNVVNNPVNRKAFAHYADDAIIYCNAQIKERYGKADYNDPAIIDEYISYICSANTSCMSDDYSLLIMNEELQPYYLHQKELDDVIPIIESRVNKITAEQQ